MVLRKVKVDPASRSRLGEPVLAELRAIMFAVDCQSCGRPFGRFGTPVLAVDSAERLARASVHHRRCRTTPWRGLSEPPSPDTPHLSWRAAVALYPDGMPVFLVNPSLEAAMLIRRPDIGGWQVAELDMFVHLGFSLDSSKEFTVLPGLVADVTPAQVTVKANTNLPGIGFSWNCTVPGEQSMIAARVRTLGYLLVGVSKRLDFTALGTTNHLMDLMERQQVALAMAELR